MISVAIPVLHAAAHLLTIRVIQSLAEGSLIGFFAGSVLRLSQRNAATRFAIWFSSLIAIAAVPIMSGEWLWRVSSGTESRALITLPDSWALYLLGFWAAGSAWLLIGIAKSLWHLRTLRRSCVEIDPSNLPPLIQNTLLTHRMIRRVALCTSAKLRVPSAIGLLRPAVVIPEWLIDELSVEELNHILLHELAHLRRWDDWTNLAQQLVKAFFFFHPVVWWIERNAALEREMACDDAVLAESESPHKYAACLARLAEKNFLHRSVLLAQAALGRIRQTTLRVSRILDPHRLSTQNRALNPALSLVTALALGCAVWSAHTSRWIAFEGPKVLASGSVDTPYLQAAPKANQNAPSFLAIDRSQRRVAASSAKLEIKRISQRPTHASLSQVSRATSKAASARLVRLASRRAIPVPETQTVLVIIEGRDPSAGAYQIQTWRVTVLRTVIDPSTTEIPHKQI